MAAYEAGLPDHVVARISDVSNTLVRRWREKKVSPRTGMLQGTAMQGALAELRLVLDHVAFEKANPDRLELSNRFRLAIRDAFSAGMLEENVAHLFGASRPTIRRWLIHASTPHPTMMQAYIPALEEEIAKRLAK